MGEELRQPVRKSRPRRAASIARWDIETDVAVLGFGGAGACVAIEARDAGLNVVAFEAASGPGGATALSAGVIYMGGGTRVQRACGFEDSVENMRKYLMVQDIGQPQDEDRVSAYVEGSVAHCEWLESMGVAFNDKFLQGRNTHPANEEGLLYTGNEIAWPHSAVVPPCPRGHGVRAPRDKGGAKLMEVLVAAATARGTELKCDARGRALIQDDDGTIVGVVVVMAGKEVNVRARKGVALCTGGFIMNETMMKHYSPRNNEIFNFPIGCTGDDGSGILMGMAAGAGTINMHEGHITTPYYPPDKLMHGILVNGLGQRFVNEDSYNGRTGSYCAAQYVHSSSRIYAIGTFEDFKDFRTGALGVDVAATGESVEELETELKMIPGSLTATIELYNRYAAKGEDPFWHKASHWVKPLEPPLVALDLTPGRGARYPNFSLGGLHTRVTGEVLDLEGNIMPGLYAAGRATCGITRYSSTYWSGLSIGDVTFFGRMAGRQVAARAI